MGDAEDKGESGRIEHGEGEALPNYRIDTTTGLTALPRDQSLKPETIMGICHSVSAEGEVGGGGGGGLNSSDPIIIIMVAASSKLSVFVLPRGGRVISETGREGDEEMEKQEGGGRN